MNKQELAETIAEQYDVERKTIGVDIGLINLIEAVLDTYSAERLPELQDKLERHDSSQFKTFGKIEEIENMQNL